jgi:hypothetical protein
MPFPIKAEEISDGIFHISVQGCLGRKALKMGGAKVDFAGPVV